MLKGATRCIKRMGLFHGDDVATRYRRLDMHCMRTKTEASIAISRGTDSNRYFTSMDCLPAISQASRSPSPNQFRLLAF